MYFDLMPILITVHVHTIMCAEVAVYRYRIVKHVKCTDMYTRKGSSKGGTVTATACGIRKTLSPDFSTTQAT